MFEYRQGARTLLSGVSALRSANPVEAEKIEIRANLLDGNTPIGNFSDAKSALIAP